MNSALAATTTTPRAAAGGAALARAPQQHQQQPIPRCCSGAGASTSGRAATMPVLPLRRRLTVAAAASSLAASSPLRFQQHQRPSLLIARAEAGSTGSSGNADGGEDANKPPPTPGEAGKKKKKRRPAPGGGPGAPGGGAGAGKSSSNLNEDLQAFLKRQAAAPQTGQKKEGSGFLGLGDLFGTSGGGGGGMGGPGGGGGGGGWNWGDEGAPGDGDEPPREPTTPWQEFCKCLRNAWVLLTNAALFLAFASFLHRSLDWCCQVELLLLVGAPRQAWEKVVSIFYDLLEVFERRVLGWNVPLPGRKIPACKMVQLYYPPEHAYSFEGSAIRRKGATADEVALLRSADALRWWERRGGYPGDIDQKKVQSVRDKYDPRGADRRAWEAARRAGKEAEYWQDPKRRAWLEAWTGSSEPPPAAGAAKGAATA
jgi:hypothetical protein